MMLFPFPPPFTPLSLQIEIIGFETLRTKHISRLNTIFFLTSLITIT
jgi:hypothetical protein